MALAVSTLKDDLLAAFRSMTDGDDRVFSEKVSKATDDYTGTGSIATVDAGSILQRPERSFVLPKRRSAMGEQVGYFEYF
jgi:hypothetical protein